MGGADLAGCIAATAEFLGPLPKGLEPALLLHGHKLAVGNEPVLVCLDKVVEIGRFIRGEALGGTVEDLAAASKDGAVVDVAGVGAQVHAVDIVLFQIDGLDKLGKVNEVRVARAGRERLIGRVAIAGRRKGQNLPIMLFARGEEIDKVIGVPAKATDAVRSRQGRDGHENTACTLHGCAHQPSCSGAGLQMDRQPVPEFLIRYAYCRACCLNMYGQDGKVGLFSVNGYAS